MADETKKPLEPSPTAEAQYAATRLFEPAESFSRQEEDIAFAAELLQSGIVNERETTAAVSDWSIQGSVSLSKHLENRGLLTANQIDLIKQSSKGRVERARRSVAGGSDMPTADGSVLLATLERLDGSGRVAKLLGITIAARGGDHDARVLEGRFEIIRKLGQGGLGRVWLARDVNLNRHVAIKEISHVSGMTDTVVERFKHEAKITGRLDHPSIVPIYQLGEDLSTGRVFYAMRFLGRSTLQDSINEYHERREEGDDDPMLLRHLLTAFVNVCHAIGHAHSRKVIHRDLKPENVVIDSFGQVIVIDWGLAKVIDETSVESLMDSVAIGNANRTSEGQVLGTPLYMAPEQAAGRLDELDHRTDIYGLGAILFAIVTGYAPHEKTQKESVDSGVGGRGMISSIARGITPSASEANSNADPALDAICQKAMARRKYTRYQEATDLAEDVQRWMAGEPVTAYRESSWQRVNRWISQHQRLSQSLLAVAIITLVALTTLGMSARQNRLAALHTRFAQMNGDVREVEVQLQGVASELAKDARFLASLPPIQGIIDARNDVQGESEDIWRVRLETIFTGILRSNPDYLALSYEMKKSEGSEDIVRVERNPADPSLVRVLPTSWLQEVETDTLMTAVGALEPGDVRLSLESRTRHTRQASSSGRLSVATPVYNNISGECFGMTAIEADFSKRIMDVLLGLGTVDCKIFVGDGLGQLWVSATPDDGVQLANQGQMIPNLPDLVVDLISKKGEAFKQRQEDLYVAQRFYVDADGKGILIFAILPEDD
jgi:serine/threonine protein kinase